MIINDLTLNLIKLYNFFLIFNKYAYKIAIIFVNEEIADEPMPGTGAQSNRVGPRTSNLTMNSPGARRRSARPKRTIVTLEGNADGVVAISKSLFKQGGALRVYGHFTPPKEIRVS
jgi:hypothetical protein